MSKEALIYSIENKSVLLYSKQRYSKIILLML